MTGSAISSFGPIPVTGTPAAGQAPIASSSTTAAWSTLPTLGSKTAKTTRTGGSFSPTNTTWAELSSTLRLTVAAVAGDILEIGINFAGGVENTYLSLDVATYVSSTLTNYVGQPGGANAANNGIFGWQLQPNGTGALPRAGTVLYTVQAGDISGGNVTVTVTCCNSSATGKTVYGVTAAPLFFYVRNTGQ